MSWIYLFSMLLIQQPDVYIIIKMNHPGAIYIQKNDHKVALSEGDRISCNDQISFNDETDWIRLSGEKGVFTMTREANPCKTTRWSASLGQMLLGLMPSKNMGRILIRGGIIRNYWDAVNYFQKYEGDTQSMFVINEMNVPLSWEYVKDTAKCYFYLTYIANKDTIDKKIPWKVNKGQLQLCFDRRLFFVDGADGGGDILKDCTMIFYDPRNAIKRVRIMNFNLRYIDTFSFRKEISLLMEGIKDNQALQHTDSEKLTIVQYYINTYYGSIDAKELTRQCSFLFKNTHG